MTKRLLILGGTGMIGHALFNELSKCEDLDVFATARDERNLDKWFAPELIPKIRCGVEADNFDSVIRAMASIQPDIVINCIGLIKQLPMASDPLSAITSNSLLPHRVSLVCRTAGARMIHVSTDCVFSGSKGYYTEEDKSDATDLYGRSKYLGEVYYPHCVTLRTSMIGHELKGKLGLVEWFLAQQGSVNGFTNAIWSGLPTVEFARIIEKYVIPNPQLSGLYQVSAEPISKYDLLKKIAERYGKVITVNPFNDFYQDRSLDSSKFREATGYQPPNWDELVDMMYKKYQERQKYYL